ncbi:MAG: glycosyltransferase family 2 protein [Gaiellaceae bacterium]
MTAATPILSVIVVSYRKGELLGKCILSAQAALRQVEGATELILVLNGASPGESVIGEELLEGIDVVYEPENIGFAPAVAEGIRRSESEWIALLNDDALAEPELFASMLAAGSSAADIGSVAAQMRFFDRPEILNSAGIEVDKLGVAYDRLLGEPASNSESEPVDVFGASGGAAMYRRTMLNEIGGFDESFFAYLEDVDVAWRARMRGWRCLYAPGAVVTHHHSTTLGHGSSRKYYLVGRNRVRLLAKNAGRAQLRRYAPWIVAQDLAYVSFIAFTQLTLAPLSGRLAGLREWKRYRRAGAVGRREIPLSRVSGLRGALRRQRVWAKRAL